MKEDDREDRQGAQAIDAFSKFTAGPSVIFVLVRHVRSKQRDGNHIRRKALAGAF